ncbi:MAG: class II fructose-bisphosphate aldolase [Planctomycetota bacterium]|nr:class II fructose-bisphosphate aldolase [Planctomycetota bacterium]
MLSTRQLMQNAMQAHKVIPAFNISYLPMMEPVIAALREVRSFGLVAVAQVDWEQFGAVDLPTTHKEYQRLKDERFTRLHLDHVPVVSEEGRPVDYESVIAEAVELGYQSVMVDGSWTDLDSNIAATRKVVDMAHAAGIPVEAEVGAVLGYGPAAMPPYEELFASRRGFTDIGQAGRFIEQSGADWLSVAVGNIHGALSAEKRNKEKTAARLDIGHIRRLHQAVNVPLVLHGGSGISKSYILQAARNGIAKINVATVIRQAYEAACKDSVADAQRAVRKAAVRLLTEELELADSVDIINPEN